MASPQVRPTSVPESFSPQERFLVEKTEEAIHDGVQLERWCRNPNRQIKQFYGGASLLGRLTLGRWNPEAFHDKVDGGMVAQHARVHQALMDGVSRIWNEWVAGGCS